MLLSGIVLLASVGIAKAEEGKYELLPKYSATVSSSSKQRDYPCSLTSNEVFDSQGTTRQKGLYKLDNPKIIYDQQAMELNIEWGANAPENTFIKVVLHGTAVTKY
jgi:hypothetical protein